MAMWPAFTQRTDWAEYFFEQLAAQSLISEFVLRSPQRIDKTQKEVGDLLWVLEGRTILFSIRCQKEPGSRSPEKEASWLAKAAAGAARQVSGALSAINTNPCWCDHPRRGRIDFGPGELCAIHGVVLIETLNTTALPTDLPLHIKGIPISYFSVNDFCNIIQELRTIPEIDAYLQARRALPLDTLCTVGGEEFLYQHYLLSKDTFAGCGGIHDARLRSAASRRELDRALYEKANAARYAKIIERVADCLAERNPNYLEGLSPRQQELFDSKDDRKAYLRLQEQLCNLRLAERTSLGRQLAGLMERVCEARPPAMAYAAALFDSKPDFVYVVASARGESRAELIERGHQLLFGAMAFYDRSSGLAIIDRDSVGFEVAMLQVSSHSIGAFHYGEQIFGRLKVHSAPLR